VKRNTEPLTLRDIVSVAGERCVLTVRIKSISKREFVALAVSSWRGTKGETKMKIDFDRVLKALKKYQKHAKKCVKINRAKHNDEAVGYFYGKLDAAKQIRAMLKRITKKNGGDL